MNYKLTFWTWRRIKILMVTLIIFGIFSYVIVNLFFPSFFYEHLAFSVFLLFAPIIACIWLFFFTDAPEKTSSRMVKVLRKAGFNVSEEEEEEVKKHGNDYNRFFVPAVLIYTFVWMIHIYYLESIDFYFLGEPIREGIHVYGLITYVIPILLVGPGFIGWYAYRKHPLSQRINKLHDKLRKKDEKMYRKVFSEVLKEERRGKGGMFQVEYIPIYILILLLGCATIIILTAFL